MQIELIDPPFDIGTIQLGTLPSDDTGCVVDLACRFALLCPFQLCYDDILGGGEVDAHAIDVVWLTPVELDMAEMASLPED